MNAQTQIPADDIQHAQRVAELLDAAKSHARDLANDVGRKHLPTRISEWQLLKAIDALLEGESAELWIDELETDIPAEPAECNFGAAHPDNPSYVRICAGGA